MGGFARPVDVGPVEALLGLVRQSAGMCVWLEQWTLELVPGELIKPDHLNDEAVAMRYQLWSAERDRLGRFSKLAVDAGVAEEQLRMTQEFARDLAARFRAALSFMEIDPGSELARQAVRRALLAGTVDVDEEEPG